MRYFGGALIFVIVICGAVEIGGSFGIDMLEELLYLLTLLKLELKVVLLILELLGLLEFELKVFLFILELLGLLELELNVVLLMLEQLLI